MQMGNDEIIFLMFAFNLVILRTHVQKKFLIKSYDVKKRLNHRPLAICQITRVHKGLPTILVYLLIIRHMILLRIF